jgi:hypothetical protein
MGDLGDYSTTWTANLLALNDESRDSTGKVNFSPPANARHLAGDKDYCQYSDKLYGHAPGDLDYPQRSAGATSGPEKEKEAEKQNKKFIEEQTEI